MDQDRKYVHDLTPLPAEAESSGRSPEESATFGNQSPNSLSLQPMDPTESQESILPFHGFFTITETNQSINTFGASESYDNVRGWSDNEQLGQGIFSNCSNQEVTNFIRLAGTLIPGYQVIVEPYTEPLTYSNRTILQAAAQQPGAFSTDIGTVPREMPIIQEFAMKEDDSEYHDQDSSEFRNLDELQDVITKLGTELQARITADVNWYVNSVEQVSMESFKLHAVPMGSVQPDAAGTDMDELIRTRFLLKLHQRAAKITQLIIKDNDPFN